MKKILFGIGLLVTIASFGQSDADRQKNFNVKNNIGLEGYDPVSFFDKKPTEGEEKTTFAYKGIIYQFASLT